MSRGSPVISVVVPTKGRLRSLERCLEALEASEYQGASFEVVVANDGGGKELEALVARFTDRLRVTAVSVGRTGPSAARNSGARAARGKYIAFTDDDCESSPGWLPALVRSLEENRGAAVGGAVRNGVPDSLGATATQIVVDALLAHWNRDPIFPRFFPSSNLAFPAEALRGIGGFNEDFRYAEDRELCERWIRSGHRFVSAPDAVVTHMRTLDLREFISQHYGYGRGVHAFHRSCRPEKRLGERVGILGELARETLRQRSTRGKLAVASYVTLAQLATAAGFLRAAAAG